MTCNEKKIKMAFRRARRGLNVVATHESVAHKPDGHQRFDSQELTAASNRRDAARRVLRLSLRRNALAVVFAHRADVLVDRQRRERRSRTSESVRLAE